MPETIATFLATHDLSSYAAACEEQGWDSLPALQAISDDDLKQLVADVEMKSGHAARLRSALGKAPPAAAAPPAQSTPGAVPAVPYDEVAWTEFTLNNKHGPSRALKTQQHAQRTGKAAMKRKWYRSPGTDS